MKINVVWSELESVKFYVKLIFEVHRYKSVRLKMHLYFIHYDIFKFGVFFSDKYMKSAKFKLLSISNSCQFFS